MHYSIMKHFKQGYSLEYEYNKIYRISKEKNDENINNVEYNIYYIDERGIICEDRIKLKDYKLYRGLATTTRYKKSKGVVYYDKPIIKLFCTDTIRIIAKDGYRNFTIEQALFSKLNVGEHIDSLKDIIELYIVQSEKENACNDKNKEFEHLFQSVKIRFGRVDTNTKYFDFIDIEIGCSTEVTIETVKQYKKKIDCLVIKKLNESDKFIKYGIPISFLKVDNIRLSKDKVLIYKLGLREK